MSFQNLSLTGIVHQTIPATATGLTSTATGTGLATKGFRNLLAVLSCGAVTGTAPTADGKLQQSDAVSGTYADITGATFTQITATPSPATDVQYVEIDLLPRDAFIRGVITIAGTTPVFPANMILILYNAVDSAYAGTPDATIVT